LRDDIKRIEEGCEDPLGVALDFESFTEQFEAATDNFFTAKELFNAQQIRMVANCGQLSSDR